MAGTWVGCWGSSKCRLGLQHVGARAPGGCGDGKQPGPSPIQRKPARQGPRSTQRPELRTLPDPGAAPTRSPCFPDPCEPHLLCGLVTAGVFPAPPGQGTPWAVEQRGGQRPWGVDPREMGWGCGKCLKVGSLADVEAGSHRGLPTEGGVGPPALEMGAEGPPQIPQAGKSTGRLGGLGEWCGHLVHSLVAGRGGGC